MLYVLYRDYLWNFNYRGLTCSRLGWTDAARVCVPIYEKTLSLGFHYPRPAGHRARERLLQFTHDIITRVQHALRGFGKYRNFETLTHARRWSRRFFDGEGRRRRGERRRYIVATPPPPPPRCLAIYNCPGLSFQRVYTEAVHIYARTRVLYARGSACHSNCFHLPYNIIVLPYSCYSALFPNGFFPLFLFFSFRPPSRSPTPILYTTADAYTSILRVDDCCSGARRPTLHAYIIWCICIIILAEFFAARRGFPFTARLSIYMYCICANGPHTFFPRSSEHCAHNIVFKIPNIYIRRQRYNHQVRN